MNKLLFYIFIVVFAISSHTLASPICSKKNDVISVANDNDLWFCLGAAHADEKSELMSFFLNIAKGKAAETYGKNWIESDFFLHLMEIERLAQEIWQDLSMSSKKILESYTAGVNSKGKIKWSKVDSILVMLLQSLDQTKQGFSNEIKEQKFINKFGGQLTTPPWETTILRNEKNIIQTSLKTVHQIPEITHSFFTKIKLSEGSNNWAISKHKSKTGKAILANDPHLSLGTPSFWQWINIKSPTTKLQGGTVPGVPLFANGTNGKVSWGLTNSYLDAGEVYLLPEEQLKFFDKIRPTVWVKFGPIKLPIFFKSFHKTKNLIVLPFDAPKGKIYVLRWSGHYLKAKDFESVFNYYRSNNINQFDQELSKIGLPSWNYVFSDINGEIGYRAVGKIAKRETSHPQGLIEKNFSDLTREPIWFEPDEMPYQKNPESHFVFSANNRHINDGRYGYAFSSSLRAKRIVELLANSKLKLKLDINDMKRIQCDVTSLEAMYLLPILLTHAKNTSIDTYFKNWDFQFKKSCTHCFTYKLWIHHILENLNIDQEPRYPEYLYSALQYKGQELSSLLNSTFKIAQTKNNIFWGDVHIANFEHVTKLPQKTKDHIALPGDTNTVNCANSAFNQDEKNFKIKYGASMRLIVEMSQTPSVWATLPDERSVWSVCELSKRPTI